jgi:hypothetical protein
MEDAGGAWTRKRKETCIREGNDTRKDINGGEMRKGRKIT